MTVLAYSVRVGVPCPTCNALKGRPCRESGGGLLPFGETHEARTSRANFDRSPQTTLLPEGAFHGENLGLFDQEEG